MDNLLNEGECFIVRRLDVPESEVLNREGNVNAMVLKKEDIPDMSMNLLGGLYKKEHLKYRTDKKASSPWNGKIKVAIKDFTNNISLLKEFSALFIPASVLHRVSIPFEAVDKKENKQAYKGFPFEKKYEGDRIKKNGECLVRHDPTVLNYWHVVLDVINPFNGEPLKNAKNAFNTFACECIINNIISKRAKPILPKNLDKIQSNNYIRS
ncbi:hypothetical protein [Desertivirga arenae]|uniref:hypothetical protein n=1 Tax=Desertivirga arenae TaxID=2810309 RepID=UPI001A96C38B|nr:hypothetical protein [Pedobacter sp. SYSU D00823]